MPLVAQQQSARCWEVEVMHRCSAGYRLQRNDRHALLAQPPQHLARGRPVAPR
eukprot:CAMPEP_0171126986 /NCGR_PEP_ID=MMETSP0766_2-20121228/114403_1 /TAXON_ID=439317 /ORGANISM="Gambierdiscus australes, Strain CAWD 149" /LENGTH=52 /DNA_ID=CAMNT_0011590061 /DNA_START=404 /DNA_END=558 /DNA_ORIENTATION=+